MKAPEGRVPGFGPDERPKRRRGWNTPWREDPINSVPHPRGSVEVPGLPAARGVPEMLADGTIDGTESEDINA